jgi:hypothetical protein
MAESRVYADTLPGVSTAERKAAMSADNLKRKLRNFPMGSLCERIAAAS